MKKILNSPYLLVTIPLLLGGMWLVLHPEIITNNIDKPYALLAGPAFIGSILLGWLFVAFFKTIAAWCKQSWKAFQGWRKQDGSTFWLVIYIFLIVSVLESGTYFNELLGSNSLYGVLGYAAAFVVDLIAVECMRARLGATRMRDKVGKRIYLLGVVACAGLSAWANTYTSLSHYHVPANTLLPQWMVAFAPWTGMAFPLLIILMSFAADYTADQTSTKLDPANYQAQEDKRFRIMEIQRDMLKKRVEVEQEIDMLSSRSKNARGPLALFVKKQQVVENVLEAISPQIEMLIEQNKTLQEQLVIMAKQTQQSQELQRQDRAIIDHQIEGIQVQLEEAKNQQFLYTAEDSLEDIPSVNEEWLIPDTDQSEMDVSIGQQTADDNGHSSVKSRDGSSAKKRTTVSATDSEKRKKVERILRQNPNISAAKLADKVGLSRSYTGQIKREYLERQNADKQQPKERITDELPVQNGHSNGNRKITQPLDYLVEMKV